VGKRGEGKREGVGKGKGWEGWEWKEEESGEWEGGGEGGREEGGEGGREWKEEESVRALNMLRITNISIYTLSDLGVLSNLIGSLSLANEHYSPLPSESCVSQTKT